MKYFYQKESKEILDELNTTTSGLNSKEVEKRQERRYCQVRRSWRKIPDPKVQNLEYLKG